MCMSKLTGVYASLVLYVGRTRQVIYVHSSSLALSLNKTRGETCRGTGRTCKREYARVAGGKLQASKRELRSDKVGERILSARARSSRLLRESSFNKLDESRRCTYSVQ
ncbi:hypothetical protein LSTR_LSTR014816 [Laodelphax striatellus]|uniref:Uncharacterized protein n=1 Tax=Laodelphax striatellus TaxID=195883 RepID=A0A482X5M7_LAOST|nr:hypothetical protein LSTR_LSTR014816 [Laodelphax striatellus]